MCPISGDFVNHFGGNKLGLENFLGVIVRWKMMRYKSQF